MKALLFAIIGAIVAIATAPAATHGDEDVTVWPEGATRAAILGRHEAGADLAWLRTVQLMGTASYMQAGMPDLDNWIDLITSLDDRFETAYYFGAVLLVTDAKRAAHVDELLARGEEALPDDFSLSMARGFIAYFGAGDTKAAADHYAAAARKPHAPPYLGPFADHLLQISADCAGMQNDLRLLSMRQSDEQRKVMLAQRGPVLERCTAHQIESAERAARLSYSKLDLQQLIRENNLWQPSDRCWTIDASRHAVLLPSPCAG